MKTSSRVKSSQGETQTTTTSQRQEDRCDLAQQIGRLLAVEWLASHHLRPCHPEHVLKEISQTPKQRFAPGYNSNGSSTLPPSS